MFIARVPNRNSPRAILLRETYRENATCSSDDYRPDSGAPQQTGHHPLVARHLLNHLSTIVRNQCRIPGAEVDAPLMAIDTTPNAKQQRAYELLATIPV
jgi:hypothetical protein